MPPALWPVLQNPEVGSAPWSLSWGSHTHSPWSRPRESTEQAWTAAQTPGGPWGLAQGGEEGRGRVSGRRHSHLSPGQASENAQATGCLGYDPVWTLLPPRGNLPSSHLLLTFHTCLSADTTCPQTALNLGPEDCPHTCIPTAHEESVHSFTHEPICSFIHSTNVR